MRVPAFDELDGVFKGDVHRGSEQQMNVFGHDDKSVDLEAAFAPIAIHGFQEQTHVVFDHEKAPTLPGLEGYEVGARRGDESYRLQKQTSAARAAIFA